MSKSRKSARKAKGEGHLRRAEILHAAEGIFVRDGYEGATIRKIADEVGLSSTALYMHFRDKHQILVEICEGAIASLLASNADISQRPIGAPARVRAMMESYIEFGLKNQNAYRLVFCRETEAAPGEAEAGRNPGVRTFQHFRAAVAAVAAESRLRHDDADIAAQVLWAACHGLVTMCITRPMAEWASAAPLTSAMLDGLCRGLIAD